MKNEAWILDRFLRGASLWADRIIVADQGSTDDSREIAARFPKVTLIENRQPSYDEAGRQRLLLAAARELPSPRVVVALDADELLSSNWAKSRAWQSLLAAPTGTVARFDWVNLLPGGERCWTAHERPVFALIDDGSEHQGDEIHNPRLPIAAGAPEIYMDDVKVLHLQYTDRARMLSKQRWYQCWERINHPRKRPIQLYRQYHWMLGLPEREIRSVDAAWLSGYRLAGVEPIPAVEDELHWWDAEVLDWLVEHGPEDFRRLDVWDVDWSAVAARLGRAPNGSAPRDPRTKYERAVLRWLERTQPRQSQARVRWLQRLLIPLGW